MKHTVVANLMHDYRYDIYARILKAHSHSIGAWRFNLSFFWVRMLFLNSWRVSVVPYYVTTHPPAIKKQHSHSKEAQIEPPLIECECEWAFRIRAIVLVPVGKTLFIPAGGYTH
jgi:hypothetical protein